MFKNLPDDLQKAIAAYLDTPSLRFFALTCRRSLRNALSYLISRQQRLLRSPSITLLARGQISLCYTSNATYACGDNRHGQLGLGHMQGCSTLTLLKQVPSKLRELQALYRQLGKLIAFSESKEQASQDAERLNLNNRFSAN